MHVLRVLHSNSLTTHLSTGQATYLQSLLPPCIYHIPPVKLQADHSTAQSPSSPRRLGLITPKMQWFLGLIKSFSSPDLSNKVHPHMQSWLWGIHLCVERWEDRRHDLLCHTKYGFHPGLRSLDLCCPRVPCRASELACSHLFQNKPGAWDKRLPKTISSSFKD